MAADPGGGTTWTVLATGRACTTRLPDLVVGEPSRSDVVVGEPLPPTVGRSRRRRLFRVLVTRAVRP